MLYSAAVMPLYPLLFALASTLAAPSPIQLNDNVKRAGQFEGNVLTVRLVADMGAWHPNGPKEKALEIAAFGEEGGPLSVPGPLIRVTEGTTVAVTLRNALSSELRVFGLCARAPSCETVSVPAGSSREIRFPLTSAGTYYYWGSTSAQAMLARPRDRFTTRRCDRRRSAQRQSPTGSC